MKYLLLGLMITAAGTGLQAATIKSDHEPLAVVVHKKDSVTLESLVAMDKKKFKGKSINEFLNSEEAKGYSELTFKHTPDGTLQGIKVKYSEKLFLNIYVNDFKHLAPYNPNRSWSMDALKQEAVDEIRVVYVMHD